MTTWDLSQTYKLIHSLYGYEQEKLARESLRSVIDRQRYSSYHFSEAMRLTKIFERKHLNDVELLLEIYVEGAERKLMAFEKFMIKAGAHSVAAVQSLHAIPDIFSHALYFATAQNLQPHALTEREISLPAVVKNLNHDKTHEALSIQLASMQSGTNWQHLAAASNMSKHRSIVRSTYTEDWTGTKAERRELHVSSFEWNKKIYPAVSLRNLLEPEYNRLFNTILNIGDELNNFLRKAATRRVVQIT